MALELENLAVSDVENSEALIKCTMCSGRINSVTYCVFRFRRYFVAGPSSPEPAFVPEFHKNCRVSDEKLEKLKSRTSV